MRIHHAAKQFVFAQDPPFRSCHASTVLATGNGDALVAWFGGSEEGAGDVAIWAARRQGGAWSEPELLAAEAELPHWNPVLFRLPDGSIALYYKVGLTIAGWETRVMYSRDGGASWSQPQQLVAGDTSGGRGPVRNKPICTASGDILAPASLETSDWNAFVDISSDQGISWTASGLVPLDRSSVKGKGVIQPTLWESTPGNVHMLLRSTEGRIYRSDSSDGGRSWRQAYPIELPNNNSGIDLVRLSGGELILAYNPVAANWGPRSPLIVSVSRDNGRSWQPLLTLEDGEGEYSYPAVVADGMNVFVTYTWKRERIVLQQFAYDPGS